MYDLHGESNIFLGFQNSVVRLTSCFNRLVTSCHESRAEHSVPARNPKTLSFYTLGYQKGLAFELE